MKSRVSALVMLVLMLLAAGGAYGLRPMQKIADTMPAVDLEVMIPKAFGDWREVPQGTSQIIDPQQQQSIDEIYAKTLMRTYVNSKGYRVMLSIAYGGDQRDALQLHLPEVCYPAQGFTVEDRHGATLLLRSAIASIHGRRLPIVRVLGKKGARQEPISYLTTIGTSVVGTGVDRKLQQLKYGLGGSIPDGMLIRFSSIDPDVANGYSMQENFANDLIENASMELLAKVGI